MKWTSRNGAAARVINQQAARDDVDGIVVTHGTIRLKPPIF